MVQYLAAVTLDANPSPAARCLIVAITPTRGVDVASKELLLSELDRITTETGASLLMASVVRQAVTWGDVDVARITMQFLC